MRERERERKRKGIEKGVRPSVGTVLQVIDPLLKVEVMQNCFLVEIDDQSSAICGDFTFSTYIN